MGIVMLTIMAMGMYLIYRPKPMSSWTVGINNGLRRRL